MRDNDLASFSQYCLCPEIKGIKTPGSEYLAPLLRIACALKSKGLRPESINNIAKQQVLLVP